MSLDSTTYTDSIYTSVPAAYRAAPKAKARRARRPVNYRASSTPATVRKQTKIRELLALAGEGLTVTEIGKALGISRQLALYHVKKMAATYQLTMVLEPCLDNGGLQYKVWDEMALASFYSRFLIQTVERPATRKAVGRAA
jgi:hypothetical protein